LQQKIGHQVLGGRKISTTASVAVGKVGRMSVPTAHADGQR
jgi:hypothetical protein